jgi:hypothetical protein
MPHSMYLSQAVSLSRSSLLVVSIFMISAVIFHTLTAMFPKLIQVGIQFTIVVLFSKWYAILPL